MRWTIERLVPGGDGLARLPDGRVGFATGALPGDRIEPFDVEDKKSFVRARSWKLVAPSPDRVTPACPVAERCGGCDWMALARAAQVEHKAAIVRDALVRVGRLRVPDHFDVIAAGPELRYRSRLRLHLDKSGRIGLFSRGTHRLVEIPGCLVSDARIDDALERLRALVRGHPDALEPFEAVEIRTSSGTPEITVHFTRRDSTRAGPLPASTRALLTELGSQYAVDDGDGEGEPPVQRWGLPGGVELDAPSGVFTQVNWAVNERLVSTMVEGALAREVERFCDLYAGAGNFALPLLARGIDGVLVEESGPAIVAAEHAARRQSISLGRFVHADVVKGLRDLLAARDEKHFDLVIADPPRTGAREALPSIVRLGVRHVALCSCDPPTLARDAAELVAAGYELRSVTVFDMFPQTHHAEVLMWMERS